MKAYGFPSGKYKDVFRIDKRITIVTGHYGSGKTNLAVNLAFRAAKEKAHGPVTIVDLDIVNPYFRTADFRKELEERGIRVIAPVYANTNLDVPALPPEVQSIFNGTGPVIIDVGGDDAGAIALGQFARRIEAVGYDMYYVINERRYLTREPGQAVELLREIEASARLTATAIVNNTNLGSDTTAELVEKSIPFAREAARLAGLPLAFTCVEANLAANLAAQLGGSGYTAVELYVRGWGDGGAISQ